VQKKTQQLIYGTPNTIERAKLKGEWYDVSSLLFLKVTVILLDDGLNVGSALRHDVSSSDTSMHGGTSCMAGHGVAGPVGAVARRQVQHLQCRWLQGG
jgi:hypothetical protein